LAKHISLSKLKPTPSSFGGKENFTGQTALLPSYILCKMQKQKNSQGSRMETIGAGGQDSTAASGPSAPVVYSHFKLIVVFFIYAHRRCCVAAATAITTVATIVVVVAAIVIVVTAAVVVVVAAVIVFVAAATVIVIPIVTTTIAAATTAAIALPLSP
jgi:hypothetical protein